MNVTLLKNALMSIKTAMEDAISTATYSGNTYDNGQRAKEALIRSKTLIGRLHEVVKISLKEVLQREARNYHINPPVGSSSPELTVAGLIKKKQQDVVVLMDDDYLQPETISEGPLAGQLDPIGKEVAERSIVVGIRSQLSSVDKNFDTLMERAFAETLNLRLRLPSLVMGEVYLLPVVEYDDVAMVENRVAWRPEPVKVSKFIQTFLAISGRSSTTDLAQLYKYERSALVLADFRESPPRVFLTLDELVAGGFVPHIFSGNFNLLSPKGFAEDIVAARLSRR